ncbi:MAG: response regulator, partial [Tatlockia sp.]|nr:response regulator [Tatlockia sp.]
AIEMAFHNEYDCILMDIGLPTLDGVKTCKAIKQLQRPENLYHSPPVVALTESSQIEHLDKCIDAGMTTILFKPVQSRPLQRLIKSLELGELLEGSPMLQTFPCSH